MDGGYFLGLSADGNNVATVDSTIHQYAIFGKMAARYNILIKNAAHYRMTVEAIL
jgi:hypothetical protein